MNAECFGYLEQIVGKSYAAQAEQARNSRSKLFANLLSHRRMPDIGWDEESIELFLREMASYDANNAPGNVGVGEREGRLYSGLVKRMHLGLAHGVGRSGDLTALQPKAAGSSLLHEMCARLALHAIQVAGIKAVKSCVVLPLATGMSMTLVLLALRQRHIDAQKKLTVTDKTHTQSDGSKETAEGGEKTAVVETETPTPTPMPKYVVWPRIDQKSCLKAITTAGFEPLVVPLVRGDGDSLVTDVQGIKDTLTRVGPANVLCVLTTTSTFAPRVPDRVDLVAQVCKELGVAHVINNAYGLQCYKCCHLVETACRSGRVDAIVQSTDKNFMVPVGGAIVSGQDEKLIRLVSECYPGRASGSPMLDLLITLLSMGVNGWKKLREDRRALADVCLKGMQTLAAKHGTRMLDVKENKISFVLDLKPILQECERTSGRRVDLKMIGSMLFSRRCSGPRVVLCENTSQPTDTTHTPDTTHTKNPYAKSVANIEFANYGGHSDAYDTPYLTVACAIGATADELQTFIKRLDDTLTEFKKTHAHTPTDKQKTDKKTEGKA
eukprot:GDKI01044732.1.p1 GENE.GDKI01044732.1~~GDKI01044732.1.p1  ORF type:complete len:552 (+),score=169.57 GDKI01044732.1:144-1799(+)